MYSTLRQTDDDPVPRQNGGVISFIFSVVGNPSDWDIPFLHRI